MKKIGINVFWPYFDRNKRPKPRKKEKAETDGRVGVGVNSKKALNNDFDWEAYHLTGPQ